MSIELPQIPEMISLPDGPEHEEAILRRRDEFFAEVLGAVGLLDLNKFVHVEATRISREIADDFIPTDDVLHELLVSESLIAAVMDRRRTSGSHEVSFMIPPLSGRVQWLITTVGLLDTGKKHPLE